MARKEKLKDINFAWNNRRFDIVLSLLKQDSRFPENFDIKILSREKKHLNQIHLIEFTEQREELHKYIIEGNFENLQNFLQQYNRSKFYLNQYNKSAVFVAITNGKFEIYAFLRSIGAMFENEEEEKVLFLEEEDALDQFQINYIQRALLKYFPRSPDAHIYYLMSKSRSLKPEIGFDEKVKKFYERLGKIPEVSLILQVIQYSDYLDIVFDFDNNNISHLKSSACSKGVVGETCYKDGRLYIAAGKKRKDDEILGTLAHEMTHWAMEILYQNNCDPYYNEQKNEFKELTEEIRLESERLKVYYKMNIMDALTKNFFEAIYLYNDKDHYSELIVKVPQLLTQFKNGRVWLTKDANKLFNYFNGAVKSKCHSFIDRSYLLKSRNKIRSINESLGEIRNFRNNSIYFKNVSKIQNFLNVSKKNVFLIINESMQLSGLRILQGMYGETYPNYCDEYLFITFSVFTNEEILTNFYSDACNALILEYVEGPKSKKKIELLLKYFKEKPKKRIVFVLKNTTDLKTIKKHLKRERVTYTWMYDKQITFNDINHISRKEILEKKINFQGKIILFKNLINGKEVNIRRLINAEAIAELISNKKINVGTEIDGFPDIEGAYCDWQEPENININSLINELLHGNNFIFVFEGLNKIKKELTRIVRNTFEAMKPKLENDCISIFKNEFSERDFKEICRNNAEKDIYWIKISNESDLLMHKSYTCKFYIDRYFLAWNEIVIKTDRLEELIKHKSSICLISNTDVKEFSNCVDFHNSENNKASQQVTNNVNGKGFEIDSMKLNEAEAKSNLKTISNIFQKIDESKTYLCEQNSKPNVDINKIHFIKNENEKEAEEAFKKYLQLHSIVYWLEKKGNKIIYKNSSGVLDNLREHIDHRKSRKMSEDNLIRKFNDERAIIIADDMGSGKSTTLTKLCSKLTSKNYWVIKIHFKDFLKNYTQSGTEIIYKIDKFINFLSKINGNVDTSLTKILLKLAIEKKHVFSRSLLIIFDGFDEILDDDKKKNIILFFKSLKEETKAKFLITTRAQHKGILEYELAAFSVQFQRMHDDDAKKEFIKKYLEIRLKLTLKNCIQQDQLSSYADKFLERVKKMFHGDLDQFWGSPLPLRFLLEDTVRNFKNWIEAENPTDPDFSYLGENVLKIYSNLINKIYNYFKKMKKEGNECSLKEIKSLCDPYHMKLAETLTLGSESEASLDNFEGISIALACGIVKCQDGRLNFIHPTVREYYASKLFMNWIEKPDRFSVYEKFKFIFKMILLKKDYQLIRQFLDSRFRSLNFERLPLENVKEYGEIVLKLSRQRDIQERKDFTYLDVVIQEEHVNVFTFAATLLHQEQNKIFLDVKCRFGDSVLIYACRCNRTNIVKSILSISGEKLDSNEFFRFLCLTSQSNETCLHHAAFYNNTEIMNSIKSKAEAKQLSKEKFERFLNSQDKYYNTPSNLAVSYLGQIFMALVGNNTKTNKDDKATFFITLYRNNKFSFPELPYQLLYEKDYNNFNNESNGLKINSVAIYEEI